MQANGDREANFSKGLPARPALFFPPAFEKFCPYLMLLKKPLLIKALLLAMLFNLHLNSVAVGTSYLVSVGSSLHTVLKKSNPIIV